MKLPDIWRRRKQAERKNNCAMVAMPSLKGCVTDTSNRTKLTDKERLENTIQAMLTVFDYHTSSVMTVIGKTKNQVITLTVHSRNNYENELNEDFDCITSNNIFLSIDGSDAPPRK